MPICFHVIEGMEEDMCIIVYIYIEREIDIDH